MASPEVFRMCSSHSKDVIFQDPSFVACGASWRPWLSPAAGSDSEPRVDFRMDESSDVPILEERSSSPIDFLQDQWLVGTDIENIER